MTDSMAFAKVRENIHTATANQPKIFNKTNPSIVKK